MNNRKRFLWLATLPLLTLLLLFPSVETSSRAVQNGNKTGLPHYLQGSVPTCYDKIKGSVEVVKPFSPTVCFPSATFASCDDNEKTNNPYRFTLKPGATMSISVTFNSGWMNAMSLVDVRTNTWFDKWPGCGNGDTAHPKNFDWTNNEAVAHPFWISQGYKKSSPTDPQNPQMPWCKNAAKIKSYTRQSITLGYTDSTSPDYLNTVITLTIDKGELPSPASEKRHLNRKIRKGTPEP